MHGRPEPNSSTPWLARLSTAVARPQKAHAVHDARVALRRLAAILLLVRSADQADLVARARDNVRWLRRALGPVRELDVLLGDVIPALQEHAPEEPALAALRAAAERRRAELLGALETIGDEPRFRAVAAAFAALGDTAVTPPRAARTLRAQYAKLRRSAAKLAKADDEALHRLRIRLRAFRYLGEELAGDLPAGEWRALRKALVAMQGTLGRYNDVLGAPELAAALAQGAVPGQDPLLLARAAGLLAGWGLGQRGPLRAALPQQWAAVDKRAAKLLTKLKN
jgi:CHAD domain-containing protein